MTRNLLIAVACLLLTITSVTAQEPEANSNRLIYRHKDSLTLDAGTEWSGWGVDRAVDGKQRTSYFSAEGDAAALKKKPWIEIGFPEDVTIRRITAWGNREPGYATGYAILLARLELRDADGKVICNHRQQAGGKAFDIDWKLDQPIKNVRRVRIISLKDQGDQNTHRCIALGEIEIE